MVAMSSAAAWIQGEAGDCDGADAALRQLEDARQACERGGQGMFLSARAMSRVDSLGHDRCSAVASKYVAKKITSSAGEWDMAECGAMDDELAREEGARERDRDRGASKDKEAPASKPRGGGFCTYCKKGGHTVDACRTAPRPRVRPSTGAAAAGAANAPPPPAAERPPEPNNPPA